MTSDRGRNTLIRSVSFLACLAVLVCAVVVTTVMLISYRNDSRKLKEIKNQYEKVKAEYNLVAEQNDPSQSNKSELGSTEIKRSLAVIAEDEELDIRENKAYIEYESDSRYAQIESLLNRINPDPVTDSAGP